MNTAESERVEKVLKFVTESELEKGLFRNNPSNLAFKCIEVLHTKDIDVLAGISASGNCIANYYDFKNRKAMALQNNFKGETIQEAIFKLTLHIMELEG